MWTLPFQTKRLTLRRFEESDVATFYAYRSDYDVSRYQGWQATTLDEARDFITEQQLGQLDTPGKWFQVAIAHRESQTLIGDIGLCLIDAHSADIGFTLAPNWQGRGFATEAVHALMRSLFQNSTVEILLATVDTRNKKSIALLERLDFKHKRTEAAEFHGAPCEQQRFELRHRPIRGSLPTKHRAPTKHRGTKKHRG
jgi:RimJ/RimL family protein N-acetyltransferase